jgi:transcriptional regulator with XRE-family HTH domain
MSHDRSYNTNIESTAPDRISGNDSQAGLSHHANMPRRRSTPPGELSHRWYLAEWAQELGKKQADAQRELGWSKASASNLWNGRQRYTQDLVDAAAAWLNIEPFELLMPPNRASALREIQSYAVTIAEKGLAYQHAPATGSSPKDKKGHQGGGRGNGEGTRGPSGAARGPGAAPAATKEKAA